MEQNRESASQAVYGPLGYSKFVDTAREQTLKEVLIDRIKAAGGDEVDYKIKTDGTDQVDYLVRVQWALGSAWASELYKGDLTKGCVIARSEAEVNSLAQTTCDDLLKRGEVEEALLKMHDQAADELLFHENGRLKLPVGRSYAHIYPCKATLCNNGYVVCMACGGSGNQIVQAIRYDHQNRPYSVSERRTCYQCGGMGRKPCMSCGGTGVMTYRADVVGFADSERVIDCDSSAADSRTGNILRNLPFKQLTEKFSRAIFKGVEKVSNVQFHSLYKGELKASYIEVANHNQDFLVTGLGDDNSLYSPPPILDGLLEDALQSLPKPSAKGSESASLMAFAEFPLIGEVLGTYAKNPKQNISGLVSLAAKGLVSDGISSRVGSTLEKLIKKASPQYSLKPWIIFGAIFLLPTYYFGLKESFIWPLLMLFGLIAVFIYATHRTETKQKLIPAEYRLKVTEWKPLLATVLVVWGFFFYAMADSSRLRKQMAIEVAMYELLPLPAEPSVKARIGVAYLNDLGFSPSVEKALKWLEPAAEQGDLRALVVLGEIHEDGKTGQKDYRRAFDHYQKAALRGRVTAQLKLAEFYQDGKGVQKSLVDAFAWYEIARSARTEDLPFLTTPEEIAKKSRRIFSAFSPSEKNQAQEQLQKLKSKITT